MRCLTRMLALILTPCQPCAELHSHRADDTGPKQWHAQKSTMKTYALTLQSLHPGIGRLACHNPCGCPGTGTPSYNVTTLLGVQRHADGNRRSLRVRAVCRHFPFASGAAQKEPERYAAASSPEGRQRQQGLRARRAAGLLIGAHHLTPRARPCHDNHALLQGSAALISGSLNFKHEQQPCPRVGRLQTC